MYSRNRVSLLSLALVFDLQSRDMDQVFDKRHVTVVAPQPRYHVIGGLILYEI